jgi:hypothetical protein
MSGLSYRGNQSEHKNKANRGPKQRGGGKPQRGGGAKPQKGRGKG